MQADTTKSAHLDELSYDTLGPVEGWKGFQLGGDTTETHLVSPTRGTAWPHEGLRFECFCNCGCGSVRQRFWKHEHKIPTPDSSCGIYAPSEPFEPMTYGGVQVLARVKLWGTIQKYSSGYRAEWAKPVQIILLTDTLVHQDWIPFHVSQLEKYGCPVATDSLTNHINMNIWWWESGRIRRMVRRGWPPEAGYPVDAAFPIHLL